MEGPLLVVRPKNTASELHSDVSAENEPELSLSGGSERRALALAAHRVLIPKEAGQERWQLPS